RVSILGMDSRSDWDLMLRCISRANQSLGRSNESMRRAASLAASQRRALDAIARFHEAQEPGDTVIAVMEKIAQSAIDYFSGGFFAMLLQNDAPFSSTGESPWQLVQFTSDGHILRSESI